MTSPGSSAPPPTVAAPGAHAASQIDPRRSRWRKLIAATAILASAALLWWHGKECWTRFPPGPSITHSLPYAHFDHPFHYHYARLTGAFFARRGAFWGYDPTFMAGYPKTLIFPTSSTLAELVFVAGGRSGLAYRVFVAATLWLTPIFVGLAALTVARSWAAFAVAVGLTLVWIWSDFPSPSVYTVLGMGPFIVASAVSVLAGCLLADWLDEPRWGRLILGGILAALATIAHPSSPVILVFILLPAYIIRVRRLTGRQHLLAWLVPLLVIAAWSPWWLPAFVHRDSYGTTASGFINANIRERITELADGRFPQESSLLIASVCAIGCLVRSGRAKFAGLAGGALLLFGVAYFGSYFPIVWALQPGRYTQPLYALLIVVVASGWCGLARGLSDRPIRTGTWIQSTVIVAGLALVGFVTGPNFISYWKTRSAWQMNATLPKDVAELAAFLRQHSDGTGRILFEDHGKTDYDPYAGINPSALMPLLAPGQYIGGPYLYTHLKSNFTQFGDAKLCEHPVGEVDRQLFERYARLYNLRWAVFWSPPMIELAEQNGDLFKLWAGIGKTRVYELVREPNWAVHGRAIVAAEPDRLEVSQAVPDASGKLVLSYHWISTLHSTVPLQPVLLEDDPVPFISVDAPPAHFVIDNRLW